MLVYPLIVDRIQTTDSYRLPGVLRSTSNMAVRGKRFELDLEAENFEFNPFNEDGADIPPVENIVREIQEHESADIPPPPKSKSTKSGFPEPKQRKSMSAFKQSRRSNQNKSKTNSPSKKEPSDRAIMHHIAKNHGVDLETKEKAEISEENKHRLDQMSTDDIEQARNELMRSLKPAFIERLLKRANIEEDEQTQKFDEDMEVNADEVTVQDHDIENAPQSPPQKQDSREHLITSDANSSSIHFPAPPRSADDFVPLDPNSSSFLADLKTHYFPNTPHDPSVLSWLQDPSTEENTHSSYNPEKDSYSTSSLRFNFIGRLIPPKESLDIEVSQGLHHHGEAPSSAGYTIPELAILERSALPNQRCIAYQTMGRILFRLGRGDFGTRGSELQEGLWALIERERVIEIMMSEANRETGHMSAKSYATEALWLWRKGGGGDRGVLKPTEKIAK